jgi:hypothetical protein
MHPSAIHLLLAPHLSTTIYSIQLYYITAIVFHLPRIQFKILFSHAVRDHGFTLPKAGIIRFQMKLAALYRRCRKIALYKGLSRTTSFSLSNGQLLPPPCAVFQTLPIHTNPFLQAFIASLRLTTAGQQKKIAQLEQAQKECGSYCFKSDALRKNMAIYPTPNKPTQKSGSLLPIHIIG